MAQNVLKIGGVVGLSEKNQAAVSKWSFDGGKWIKTKAMHYEYTIKFREDKNISRRYEILKIIQRYKSTTTEE